MPFNLHELFSVENTCSKISRDNAAAANHMIRRWRSQCLPRFVFVLFLWRNTCAFKINTGDYLLANSCLCGPRQSKNANSFILTSQCLAFAN